MSDDAPDIITDIDQRNLFNELGTKFEDFCGQNPDKFKQKEKDFIEVVEIFVETIKLNSQS